MNASFASPKAVTLLSRITGQVLRPQDLSPLAIFLATLISVLLGVITIDRAIVAEERQRLQKTLEAFMPPDSRVHQLTQRLISGVYQQQVYLNPQEMLLLAEPLSESERLLIVSLGYEISAADGTMDFREKMYLQSIGQRLSLDARHLEVLEAGFTQQTVTDSEVLYAVRHLLAPAQFRALDVVFVKVANHILMALPELSV